MQIKWLARPVIPIILAMWAWALYSTVTVGLAQAQTSPLSNTAQTNDSVWPGFNRTLTGERYSGLNEITTANIGTLQQICAAQVGEAGNFQSGIIVVNNTLYVTTHQDTYALDPATCVQKWQHHYAFTPSPAGLHVNRGVAYADGKIFRGIDAGFLIALDAQTGQQIWQAQAADAAKGETLPAAPVTWNGLVYIGNAGGDNKGVRGRMMAFDANDGHFVWNFDLVPLTGPGAETWPPDTPDQPRTGGATWTSYTIDPATGLLYVPAGNAAPDFNIAARPGKNLYSNSVVALDAKTGALRDYYQLTPNDFHDYDVSATSLLVTTAQQRRLIISAGKDGMVHAIDPAQHTEVYSTAVTTFKNGNVPLTPQGVRFCPGINGGVEWNGPAYHPTSNLIYVNTIDWCTTVKLAPQPTEVGKPYTGHSDPEAPFGQMDPRSRWHGWVYALNADSGKVKWRYNSTTPMVAGVTTTAGDLVLTGDLNGNLLAFNANTGKVLLRRNVGQAIGGGIVTYAVNGKQYIAVAAGIKSQTWATQSTAAQVLVFALP